MFRALAASASAAVSASACQPLLRSSATSNTRLVSRAYTRVTIIGRIGADPELRTLDSGNKVVSFPLAAHRSGGQDGKEITMWFRCYFFDQPKLTQYVDEQVTKGALVVVDGELTQRQVPGANGKEVTFTEVNIGRTSLACWLLVKARHCLTNALSLSVVAGLLAAFLLCFLLRLFAQVAKSVCWPSRPRALLLSRAQRSRPPTWHETD
jgi:single-strand DNA-binding protein